MFTIGSLSTNSSTSQQERNQWGVKRLLFLMSARISIKFMIDFHRNRTTQASGGSIEEVHSIEGFWKRKWFDMQRSVLGLTVTRIFNPSWLSQKGGTNQKCKTEVFPHRA
jgi:hypothetical protein